MASTMLRFLITQQLHTTTESSFYHTPLLLPLPTEFMATAARERMILRFFAFVSCFVGFLDFKFSTLWLCLPVSSGKVKVEQ